MSDRSSSNESASERSPWSRPSVLLSAAFLLALVLLGVLIAATGGGAGGGERPATPTAPARIASTMPASTSGGCSLPAGDDTVPSNSPPRARWGTVGAMQVPQQPGAYGPQHVRGVYATCFAHDPAGALLAAINFYAESTTGVPASTVMRRYALGAPANLGNDSGIDDSGPVQLAGYRYDSYTPAAAEISVVFEGSRGQLVAIVTPMAWHAGDWKYVFPPGGQPSLQAIRDLSGYVSWSDFG